MKKKSKSRRNAAPRPRRRNASARELAGRAGRAVAGAASSARRRLSEPEPHWLQDVLATAVAGGGASAIAGLAVRKGIDPKWVSLGMMGVGTAAAWKAKGTLRAAATSIVGAGAGQLALTLMQEKAIADLKTAMAAVTANQTKPAATTPALGSPSNAALPPGSSFEERLALHSQLADDAARFTEPEADYYAAAS